ncbi:MAG: hypothetical protein ACYCQI_05035 [Gammaproteobacteria bacterium]
MSSPRIHFFLGAEFSNMVANGSLNLEQLAENFLIIKQAEKEEKSDSLVHNAFDYFSKIIFYSADETNPAVIREAAKQFGPNDIIIAASAGGRAAKPLVDELAKHHIHPAILAFEAFGLEEQPGVIYFRQHGNPRSIPTQENQTTYEYKDDTTYGGGRMIGHAAYTIRPAAIAHLNFKEAKQQEKNPFLAIKNADCTVAGKTYHYDWLVGRQGSASQLATDRSAVVFNFGFIAELGFVVAKKMDPVASLSAEFFAVDAIKVAPKLSSDDSHDDHTLRRLF